MNHDGSSQDEAAVNPAELRTKMKEYGAFIETLHTELTKAVKAREEIEKQITEYQQLSNKLVALEKRRSPSLESLVSLGHDLAYCRAVIDDTAMVCVHVGMGFHAEFALDEAVAFIQQRRLPFLEEVRLNRAEKARTVASHLESALVILDALANDLRERETDQH